jgi:hypothetical protein
VKREPINLITNGSRNIGVALGRLHPAQEPVHYLGVFIIIRIGV